MGGYFVVHYTHQIKALFGCVALAGVPIVERILRRQTILHPLNITGSVGFITCPNFFCMNPIPLRFWSTCVVCFHAKSDHQLLQSTFCGHTVQMVGIRQTRGTQQVISIAQMSAVGIE